MPVTPGMGPGLLGLLTSGLQPQPPTPQDETDAAEAALQELLSQAEQKTMAAQQAEQSALMQLQAGQAQPAEEINPLAMGAASGLARLGTTLSDHDYSAELQAKAATTNKSARDTRKENLRLLRETYEEAAKTAREAGDHEAEIKSRTAIAKLDQAAKKDAAATKVQTDKDAAAALAETQRQLQGLKHQDKLKEIQAQATAKKGEPPSPKDLLQGINTLTDNIRQDPELKDYAVIRDQLTTGRDAMRDLKNANSADDIILMRAVARATDPRTGVREEEYRTFESAQGALAAKWTGFTKGMVGKGKLNEFGRRALIKRLEELHSRKKFQAKRSYERFGKQVDLLLPGVNKDLVLQMYEPEEESEGGTSTDSTTTGVVRVRTANGQTGSVPAANVDAWLKANPGSSRIE